RRVGALDREAEEPPGEPEEPLEDALEREVRPELLLRDRKPLLLHPLRVERDVPRLELPPRVARELADLALGDRLAAPCEIAQEVDDLRGRSRHVGRERQRRVALVSEQRRGLVAQLQDLLDQRAVVPPPRARAAIGRARDPRLVVLLAELRRF